MTCLYVWDLLSDSVLWSKLPSSWSFVSSFSLDGKSSWERGTSMVSVNVTVINTVNHGHLSRCNIFPLHINNISWKGKKKKATQQSQFIEPCSDRNKHWDQFGVRVTGSALQLHTCDINKTLLSCLLANWFVVFTTRFVFVSLLLSWYTQFYIHRIFLFSFLTTICQKTMFLYMLDILNGQLIASTSTQCQHIPLVCPAPLWPERSSTPNTTQCSEVQPVRH